MRLAPSGEDKGPGSATSMPVNTVGRSFILFLESSTHSPEARPKRSTFTNRQDFPTLRPVMIRNLGQIQRRQGLARRARSGRFWLGAHLKISKGEQSGIFFQGAMPMILLIDPFSVSGFRVFARVSIVSPTWWESPQSSAGRKSPAGSCPGFHSSGYAA